MSNPFGLHAVTPYLVVRDVAGVVSFAREVFGAELRGEPKYGEQGGIMHAELRIEDSVIVLGEPIEGGDSMPSALYVYVADCDETYSRALAAGATSVLAPADYPHGDRYGGVRDSSGNIWWAVTHMLTES